MNQGQIKHITNNHYRKLKKHIKIVTEDFDVEAIHHFRVAYKKLRAFLRIISQQHETAGEIKFPKKLKRGYNISGSVSDLQLQQQRILEATKQELKKPQAYISLLQKEIEKLQPELSEVFLEKPKEKEQILMADVVLCRSLATSEEMLRQTVVSQTRISKVLAEMEALCKI